MKAFAIAALFAATAALPVSGFTAESHAGHGDHGAMTATADTALTEGVVKKVDKAGGKVTLSHGPLTNLGMPGMTMAFKVKDSAWLDQLKEGDKVRFMADQVNGAYTVVRLEKNK